MSTQNQALVTAALESIGLEFQPNGPPGSPSKLAVTEATVEKIKSLVGSDIIVDGAGKLVDEKPLD